MGNKEQLSWAGKHAEELVHVDNRKYFTEIREQISVLEKELTDCLQLLLTLEEDYSAVMGEASPEEKGLDAPQEKEAGSQIGNLIQDQRLRVENEINCTLRALIHRCAV